MTTSYNWITLLSSGSTYSSWMFSAGAVSFGPTRIKSPQLRVLMISHKDRRKLKKSMLGTSQHVLSCFPQAGEKTLMQEWWGGGGGRGGGGLREQSEFWLRILGLWTQHVPSHATGSRRGGVKQLDAKQQLKQNKDSCFNNRTVDQTSAEKMEGKS